MILICPEEFRPKPVDTVILLMAEILHQLTGSLSHYLRGVIHPRWLFWISSINSIALFTTGFIYLKWFAGDLFNAI